MIFPARATTTNRIEKISSDGFRDCNDVLIPMLAKNTGAKNIYELMSIFLAIYSESLMLHRMIPATYAPVMSAIPKYTSAM